MLVKKKDRSYTTDKKYIRGKGFMDSAASALRNVGSYMYQNKDLWAKPLIGTTGELAAFGAKELGKKAIMNYINKKNKALPELSPKELEIIQNIQNTPNMAAPNIIGSGIKKF